MDADSEDEGIVDVEECVREIYPLAGSSVTMVQQAMTAPSSPSWTYKKYLQSNSLPVRIAEKNATDDYSGPALFAADAYVLILI